VITKSSLITQKFRYDANSKSKKEICYAQAILIARTLRTWARANIKARKVNAWRLNQRTGIVIKRTVNRRARGMSGVQEFCSVNDGKIMGCCLDRDLKVVMSDPGLIIAID